jgi:hypothetical protein
MSQTPSSTGTIFPTGQFDVGPGGIITDSPANRELLDLVEQASPLSVVELYTLAVSYQKVASNSALGNHLAFIALENLFQNPMVQQIMSATSQPVKTSCSAAGFWCCITGGKNCGCECSFRPVTRGLVKRVPVAGFELLVEVTQTDENKTFAILGISPTVLAPPVLTIQVQNGATSSDAASV